ncbi:MAG: malonyl-CoA decarboxylase domain-containing protein [Shimia sp.]
MPATRPDPARTEALMADLFRAPPPPGARAATLGVEALSRALVTTPSERQRAAHARAILARYRHGDAQERAAFHDHLAGLEVDALALARAVAAWQADPSPRRRAAMTRAAEAPRKALYRRLADAPNGVAALVALRADLRAALPERPELAGAEQDLRHLFQDWFDRSALTLRRMAQDDVAPLAPRLLAAGAIGGAQDRAGLEAALRDEGRRLYAWSHPRMPEAPLVCIEVTLCQALPDTATPAPCPARRAHTAVLGRVTELHPGLAGVPLGASLVSGVVRDLRAALPGLRRFVALAPVAGLRAWHAAKAPDETDLTRAAARYLARVKTGTGRPRDPAARMHFANGAHLEAILLGADRSAAARADAYGIVARYRYDPARMDAVAEAFATRKAVTVAERLRPLLPKAPARNG